MGVFSIRFLFASTIAIIFIGNKINHQLEKYGVFSKFNWDTNKPDISCESIGVKEMSNSEDLQMGKHNLIFISVGDLHNIMGHGTDKAENGGVFVYDMNGAAGKLPIKLEVNNFPEGHKLFVHGLYISNSTDRLYAVNHQGHADTIEVFSVTYSPSCISFDTFTCPPVSLTHTKTIASPLFINFGMNDVAEGKVTDNGGELYTTRWLYSPLPQGGKKDPNNTLQEKLWDLQNTYIALSETRLPSNLVRCWWGKDEEAKCEDATVHQFVAPNGITTTPDRSFVFVSDPTAQELVVLKRQSNGQLVHHVTHKLPYAVDNLDYDAYDGSIVAGGMPVLWKTVLKVTGLGDPNVPGSILRITNDDWGRIQFDNEFLHNGDIMTGSVSMGLRRRSSETTKVRFVLGSPFSRGILVCDRV